MMNDILQLQSSLDVTQSYLLSVGRGRKMHVASSEETWTTQGTQGLLVMRLGYPSVQNWVDQIMPEVRMLQEET